MMDYNTQTGVLSLLLKDKTIYSEIGEYIKQIEYFESVYEKSIFHSIDYLYSKNIPVNDDNLKYELEKYFKNEENQSVKQSAIGTIETLKNINISKDLVLDDFYNNYKAITFKNVLIQNQESWMNGKYDYIYDEVSKLKTIGSINDFGLEITQHLDIDTTNKETIPTGFKTLDNYFTKGKGIPKKTLNLFKGIAGSGKSFLLSQVGVNAYNDGKNILYISCELSEQQIIERVRANLLSVEQDEVLLVDDNIIPKVENKFYVHYFNSFSICSNDIAKLLKKYQEKGITFDILIVDYIQLINPNKKSSNDSMYLVYGFVSSELRSVANDFNLVLWTASQKNRDGYDKKGNGSTATATNADTSGSMGIIHNADVVIDWVRTEEDKQLNMGKLSITKNRFGADGFSVDVHTDLKFGKIYE